MSTVEKRGKSWRALIRRKGFRTESATFRRKAEADQWAAERDGELVGARHGIIPRRTVRQAVERYISEVSPKHRGHRWEVIRLQKILRALPFADRELAAVSPSEVSTWTLSLVDSGLAESSIRREYGLLRAVFAKCAREWGLLRQSPFRSVEPPAEGRARTRRVLEHEVAAIVSALGYNAEFPPQTASDYVALAFLFALETAMRKGEILSITRDRISRNVAHLDKTKNGDSRDVPLSRRAVHILDQCPDDGYCFPIASGTCDTLFRRAVRKAGIVDLHFHDSRREALTRLSKKVDVMTLAKISGHRDLKTLLRVYYAPSMQDVADRLD